MVQVSTPNTNTHTHTHTHTHTQLTIALSRAKSIPMMAETQNMSKKSPSETSSTFPGLAVLVACFNIVLSGVNNQRPWSKIHLANSRQCTWPPLIYNIHKISVHREGVQYYFVWKTELALLHLATFNVNGNCREVWGRA